MSESRQKEFWIGLTVFQVIFGLTVFGLTRHYYLGQRESVLTDVDSNALAATLPQSARNAIAALPDTLAESMPQSPDAIARRADEQFSAREYEAAATLYERLLALDPTNVDVMNNLGITLHYLKRTDDAFELLNAGLGIDPEHQRSWLTLGFINAQLGKREDARAALTNAYRLGTDDDIRESAANMMKEMGFEIPGD